MSEGERRHRDLAETVPIDPASAKTMADTGGAAQTSSSESGAWAAGQRIGRFRVEGKLGEGAMGVVLAAHDPELDRRVALKLLRASAWGGGSSSAGRERLLREARAMANLSHPNVLTVYDVGTVGDQVFVAMELAAGGTLRQWWKREDRPWREVVARFLDAARGLDAAHRAGLVHRDFKPDNALITADDDVRVADFGLVGVGGAPDGSRRGRASAPMSISSTLTQDGAVLGTPAYMAPEQHMRGTVGPAADQFSFCVSLHEALYGLRPFAADTLSELADDVIAGRLTDVPADTDVPRWVRDVIVRGLAADPEARWPSMAALIEALSADPEAARRRRRHRIGVGAAVIVLAGLATFGLLRSRESSLCRGAGARFEGVWDGARRAAVRRAFLATERPYAADTFDRVAAQLDDYRRSWIRARTDACEATHERGEQSDALLDLRMRCYDRRLREMAGLTEMLSAGPDVQALDSAAKAALSLSPLDACADVEALQAAVPPPTDPAVRARVEQLQDRLDRAKAMHEAGKRDDALAEVQAVRAEAEEIGYLPLRARAQFRYARTAEYSSLRLPPDELVANYEQAARLAADAREDDLVALSWVQVIWIKGYAMARYDEALALRTTAEVALARAGNDDYIEARLLNAIGVIYDEVARHEEAQVLFERALELRRQAFGPKHPEVAAALNNLGDSFHRSGDYERALAMHEQSLAMKIELLGPKHPDVTPSLVNLGVTTHALGKYDEAWDYYDRARELLLELHGSEACLLVEGMASVRESQRRLDDALALYEHAVEICVADEGEDHPQTALALRGLGGVRHLRGELDEAEQALRRALSIRETALGADHYHTGLAASALGAVLLERGDLAGARPVIERALRILDAEVGPGNYNAEAARIALGELHRRAGRLDAAAAQFTQTLAGEKPGSRESHARTAAALIGLAEIQLRRGQRDDAVASAQRAAALVAGDPLRARLRGRAQFVLARAERDAEAARDHARRARDELAAAPPIAAAELRAVERWLRR